MTYLSWAMYCEGPTDRAYLNILIPRVMQEILLKEGVRPTTVPADPAILLGTKGREVDKVAAEICETRSAFHLLFIHADVGGRELSRTLNSRSTAYCLRAAELCDWDPSRCVYVTPRHEIEAWALSDNEAVSLAFGYRGPISSLGLPESANEAERIIDPKIVLNSAYRAAAGRRAARGASQTLPAIARNQQIQVLRLSPSFREFENSLRLGLQSLGCIPQ